MHFDASQIDLDLDSRSQESKKAKISGPDVSQSFQLIWMEFGVVLRREMCWCDESHTCFISSVQYSRERTLLM